MLPIDVLIKNTSIKLTRCIHKTVTLLNDGAHVCSDSVRQRMLASVIVLCPERRHHTLLMQ